MGKKARIMKVDGEFYDKVFDISGKTGMPGTKITGELAKQIEGVEFRLKTSKKKSFSLFK